MLSSAVSSSSSTGFGFGNSPNFHPRNEWHLFARGPLKGSRGQAALNVLGGAHLEHRTAFHSCGGKKEWDLCDSASSCTEPGWTDLNVATSYSVFSGFRNRCSSRRGPRSSSVPVRIALADLRAIQSSFVAMV